MPLPFRPNCLPAALGPLPHRTARAAWDVCLRYLPAMLPLPLLVEEGEEPARLVAEGFGGATLVRDQLRFDHAAAAKACDELYMAYLQNRAATRALDLAAFSEWTVRDPQIRRAQALCTVLMGPISVALRLVDDERVPALNDLVVVDALAKHLYLRLRWQRMAVGRSAATVVQWLYEPYLEVVGTPFSPIDWAVAGQLFEDAFGTDSGVRAVWTNPASDIPALLAQPAVEVVGMALPLPAVAETWAPALGGFIRRRGVLGWGIVPQTPEGLASTRVGRLAARFNEFLQALEAAGLPVAEVVAASLIMPEDLLGDLAPNEAEAALALTSQLSGLLRHSYGLD